MPRLSQISYTRDACIAAVRDYYSFLTKMYLDESVVAEPPEGGWQNITAGSLKGLDKTDEVIALLRHLPYLRGREYVHGNIHGAAWCEFADWDTISKNPDAEGHRICSEDPEISKNVPSHVISLTYGGLYNPVFLVDTELGTVNWWECPSGVSDDPLREPILDDPYDWAPENEAEWRADGAAWAITDFFEVLKDQFRNLRYIPISSRQVVDIWTRFGVDTDRAVAMLQDIYREHGWPDLERYRKRECLEAVKKALDQAAFRINVWHHDE